MRRGEQGQNGLNQTGLEEVNLKFNLNELKFKQAYVVSGSWTGLLKVLDALQFHSVMVDHSRKI